MTKDSGGFAFPCEWVKVRATPGMTLRDYFAAKAMQSLVANPNDHQHMTKAQVAEWSYAMADAMIEARAK